MSPNRFALALTVSVALVVGAGCGGSSGGDDLSDDSLTAATVADTDPPDDTAPEPDATPAPDAPGDTEPASTDASDDTQPSATDAPGDTEPASSDASDDTQPSATDAPGDTEPASTDAPPDTEFVLGADTVASEFAGGYLRMDVWPGWEVADAASELDTAYESEASLTEPWTFDADEIDQLALLENADASLAIMREPRFATVPDAVAWRAAVVDWATSVAGSPAISAPAAWAGLDGDFDSFSGDAPVAIRTAEADGQYVMAVTYGVATEELADQVTAMLENVRFDASVVPLLAHARETRFHTDALGSEFTISGLAPLDWVHSTDDDGTNWYDDPDGDGFVAIDVFDPNHADYGPAAGDPDAALAAQIDEDVAAGYFVLGEPTPVETTIDGVPATIVWEGSPDAAVSGVVYATDGVYLSSYTFYAPDDRELAEELVDSILFIDHA